MNYFYRISGSIALGTVALTTVAYLTSMNKRRAIYSQAFDTIKSDFTRAKTYNVLYNLNVYHLYNERLRNQKLSTGSERLRDGILDRAINFTYTAAIETVAAVVAEVAAPAIVGILTPGVSGGIVEDTARAGFEFLVGETIGESTNRALEFVGDSATKMAKKVSQNFKKVTCSS